MKLFYNKLRALIDVFYANMLEYRIEIFLWTFAGILPFILMGVWMQASADNDFPLAPVDFARYFLVVFLVRQLTVVWVAWDFEYEVVQGILSNRLLQPLDPFWRFFSAHLAERLTRLPLLVGLTALFFLIYPESFWFPRVDMIVRWGIATVSAFLLRFAIQYTFAMLTFWVERASSLEQLWFLPYIFLSGAIAPLEVFPPLARTIALATPFPYLVYYPAQLLIDGDSRFGYGLWVILAWGIGFVLLNRWLWRRGLKHYSGMGA